MLKKIKNFKIDQRTRIGTIAEALISLLIGYGINYAITRSLIGILFQNEALSDDQISNISTSIFTVLSLIRSYSMRRLFVWLSLK